MIQLNIFDSRAARDIALSTVSQNSGSFIDEALEVISSLEPGRKVTGEDIRQELDARKVFPHHSNAYGSLINIAVRRKLLVPTPEFVSMKRVSSHARSTRVYLTSFYSETQPMGKGG